MKVKHLELIASLLDIEIKEQEELVLEIQDRIIDTIVIYCIENLSYEEVVKILSTQVEMNNAIVEYEAEFPSYHQTTQGLFEYIDDSELGLHLLIFEYSNYFCELEV
jgi:hypothetical protein